MSQNNLVQSNNKDLMDYIFSKLEESEGIVCFINSIYKGYRGLLVLTNKQILFVETEKNKSGLVMCSESLFNADSWGITKKNQFITNRYSSKKKIFQLREQDIQVLTTELKNLEKTEDYLAEEKKSLLKNYSVVPVAILGVYLISVLFLDGNINPFAWWDYKEVIGGLDF